MPATDECGEHSCSQVCGIVNGQEQCSCYSGYELLNETGTVCVGQCKDELSIQPLYLLTFTKNSHVYIYIHSVQLSLLDIDECSVFDPCEQICTNTNGSHKCSCNDGYAESEVSASKCSGTKLSYDDTLYLCL